MSSSIPYSYYSPCHLGSVNGKQNVVTFVASVIITILSPVAVVENALIMTAIWKNHSLRRTPSYILLGFLAFTDLCTGLITQPFHTAAELICILNSEQERMHLSFLAYARAIAEGSGTYFSSLTLFILTLMSVERWLYMTRRSLLTVRRSYVMMTCTMFLLMPLVALRLLHLLNNTHRLVSNAILFVILLFCLTISSTAYFKVVRIIRGHQRQIQAHEPRRSIGQSAIDLVKYKKSVFTILYILGVFYISYLPLVVFIGLSFHFNHSDLEMAFIISLMFLFLSSAINPLICLWRMSDIRNGVKQLLRKLLCKET